MNIWGRPQQRHYTHELPYLDGKAIKRLMTLSDIGWRWVSSQGRTIEFYPVVSENNLRTYRAKVKNGRERLFTLTATATQFNGRRWWFVCPHCHRRQGKIYWSDADVACRKCFGLHYASQSESRMDRMREMISKQREAIWGDNPLIHNLFESSSWFPKPKGMRWTTFEIKRDRLLHLESIYWRICGAYVARLTGKKTAEIDDIEQNILSL